MSTLLIKNGLLVTLNDQNQVIENGSVYIEGAKITEVGHFHEHRYKADQVLDAGGRLVMPGLINAHHHLYSTFACGFAPPGKPAVNFKEILEHLWWKVDLALTAEDVYYSALLPLMDCVKHGVTTIIDHHASPSCRDGSLDLIEKAVREVGINANLCYEVSDRNIEGGGIEENERFIRKCAQSADDQVTALFGLHASMTIGPKTMDRCATIGREHGAGFHVHVAEDLIDQEVAQKEFGKQCMVRFRDAGMTGPKSLFIHGVHLDDPELDILAETRSIHVHNAESNMNNAVGSARLGRFWKRGILSGLGTDGMASNMIASARAAYLLQRHLEHDPRVAFGECCDALLKKNREICERLFKTRRGVLAPGALGDVAIFDYTPFTPLSGDNFYGHFLFGLYQARVNATVCRGRVLMKDGVLPHLDEAGARRKARELAAKMWKRIQ